MAEPKEYLLGYRREEQERLQQQAERLAHEAAWLFDQLDLPSGAHVLEIGCGPRGCLDLLSERVGPSGRVIGVESSEDAVVLAQKFVAERGLRNVEVLHQDARSTGLPKASFDLVTARLVLVNVPDPEQIVSEAAALTRLGGLIAFHEVDWAAMVCDPPLPAWNRLVELFITYSEKNGIDLFIGRKVPRLLRNAGLVDVCVNPLIHVYTSGDGGRRILLNFAENLRERIVAQKIVTEQTFTELTQAVKEHIENPETLIVWGPFLQVWGRKPA